ncbi:MAG: pyridoxal kinase PdxY [Alphaproteobacteria bacterium]|nr:pyridoxal kinase PdxY [Alphaproteobacteria bacterium]
MSILSIQSHVAYGHVGNAAAVFPLQRLGLEVWPVNTVEFSNHLGYESFRGRVLDRDLVADVVKGVGERGAFAHCRGVLTGYLGDAALGDVALRAVHAVRRASPKAIYACDPVIGDDGRSYVRPGVAEFFRDAVVPAADLLFPNHFELETLTGAAAADTPAIIAAARALVRRGPRLVVCTSFRDPSAGEAIDALAVTAEAAWRIRVPRLALAVHGTGDAFAALFLGRWLEQPDPARALGLTVSSLHGILRATLAAGGTEMSLIAAQDEIVNPSRAFPVEPLG